VKNWVPYNHGAEIAGCLYSLTGSKAKFCWTTEHQTVFDKLKAIALSETVLAYPNIQDPFVLDTDAAESYIGAVLLHIQEGCEKPIAFASKTLTPTQREYCVTRREWLAVVMLTRQFCHYLLGRKFTLRTDHSSLVWLI
jgi:hypothetical protein